MNNIATKTKSEIILYQSVDGETKVDVILEHESVWLTQEQMSILFNVDRTSINKHINNIFDTKELDQTTTCAKIAQHLPDGRLLFSGTLLLLITLLINPSALTQLLSLKVIITVTIFGLVFRCLDFILWYQAIARISVSKASAVIPVAVAVTFLSSIFIFKESISIYQILGLVLILGGLLWLSKVSLTKNTS